MDINSFTYNFHEIYKHKCKTNYLPSILPAVSRIIVIGDIHGDMNKLIECLKIAKLINNMMQWIGGETVIVQVGDQIDSCNRIMGSKNCNNMILSTDTADDIKILYFMTELHEKASHYGGAVYSLVGNHELMNAVGDMTYVSRSNLQFHSIDGTIDEGRQKRIELFTPGNTIAKFIACTRKMALVIGSNLFVHGGIIPLIAKKYGIEDMNMLLTKFLLGETEIPTIFKDLFTNGQTSPLWTRVFGMISGHKLNCNEYLPILKNIYNVNNIYVGHTPQLQTGITHQCNERVWLTDIGMSKAFAGNNKVDVEVLEILNDNQFNILK